MREPRTGFLFAEIQEVVQRDPEPVSVALAGKPEPQTLVAVECRVGLDLRVAEAPIKGASGKALVVECEVAPDVFEDCLAASQADRNAAKLDLPRDLDPTAARVAAIGGVDLDRGRCRAVRAEISSRCAGSCAERALPNESQEISGRAGAGQGDLNPSLRVRDVTEPSEPLVDRDIEDRAPHVQELEHRIVRLYLGFRDPDGRPSLSVGELRLLYRSPDFELAVSSREGNALRVAADPDGCSREPAGTDGATVPVRESDRPAVR